MSLEMPADAFEKLVVDELDLLPDEMVDGLENLVFVVEDRPEDGSLDLLGEYQKIARTLRAAGIGTEVYPDAKKLGPQFQYAEKRGFKLAVIVGQAEIDSGMVKLKNLTLREEKTVPLADLLAICQSGLKADG